MKTKFITCLALFGIMILSSCNDNSKQKQSAEKNNAKSSDSAFVRDSSCDIKLDKIQFTKSINGADTLAKVDEKKNIQFHVGEKKDYFSDPNNKLSNNTAPILLSKIDNTKPFTLTAKVSPEFTETGLYNAGVLYLYVHDNFYQKFCFEQDERGNHRIVTVRTIGTSDDNNHDIVQGKTVYMKISSDTQTVASYYSLDNKTWQMVRLYKNNYPAELWGGISAQCPVDKGTTSYFEAISLEQKSVKDFRLGI
jgi:regulation of enolase protein 1 (concanavalin A-like superfamily)